MEIAETRKNNLPIVSLRGRLDAVAAPRLQEKLDLGIRAGERAIAINCSGLEYISSSGLRVILLAAKQLQALKGNIVLFALSDAIREVFEVAGFPNVLPIVQSETEALARLEAKT